MDELFIERKTAIYAVHFAGHTPLYIETEPFEKERAQRERMDSMIENAEALITLFQHTEGHSWKELGNRTPIQYEFLKFREKHPNSPVFVFRKQPDRVLERLGDKVEEWFKIEIDNLVVQRFSRQEELIEEIIECLTPLPKDSESLINRMRKIIRYTGADFLGLIECISEVLHGKGMNIDYISHASRGGKATLYISCSIADKDRSKVPTDETLEDLLGISLNKAFDEAKSHNLTIPGAENKAKPYKPVQVEEDHVPLPEWQFCMELRTIDAPGQLNAVCKVLKDNRFNIDELILKPTEKEYERQTTMNFWLSKMGEKTARPGTANSSGCQTELGKLETAVSLLVGVRAFSIKVVKCSCPAEQPQEDREGDRA